MKTREVTLAGGERFTVPQGIQRLDSHSTRGWQVRYQGTKYFADGTDGPKKSLERAARELYRRIATLPAPVKLKRVVSPSKSSGLPVGISGPIVRERADGRQVAVLSVVVPRFGQPSELQKIYIGTPSTYTKAAYRAALSKAVQARQEGVARYEEEATRAKRKLARQSKKSLAAAAAAA